MAWLRRRHRGAPALRGPGRVFPGDARRREARPRVPVELARAHGLRIEFRDLREAEVRVADEIWVTSSSKEVLAVVRLDGAPVGEGRPGPVFRRMYRLYQDFKQKVMRAGRRESLPA